MKLYLIPRSLLTHIAHCAQPLLHLFVFHTRPLSVANNSFQMRLSRKEQRAFSLRIPNTNADDDHAPISIGPACGSSDDLTVLPNNWRAMHTGGFARAGLAARRRARPIASENSSCSQKITGA